MQTVYLTSKDHAMPTPPPLSPAAQAAASVDARAKLRQLADRAASIRGHALGSWREAHDEAEIAYCASCRRTAEIDAVREPHLAGLALTLACDGVVTQPLTGEELDLRAAQLLLTEMVDCYGPRMPMLLIEMVDRYGPQRVGQWTRNYAHIIGKAV